VPDFRRVATVGKIVDKTDGRSVVGQTFTAHAEPKGVSRGLVIDWSNRVNPSATIRIRA